MKRLLWAWWRLIRKAPRGAAAAGRRWRRWIRCTRERDVTLPALTEAMRTADSPTAKREAKDARSRLLVDVETGALRRARIGWTVMLAGLAVGGWTAATEFRWSPPWWMAPTVAVVAVHVLGVVGARGRPPATVEAPTVAPEAAVAPAPATALGVSMPRLTDALRQARLCGPDGQGVTEVIGLATEPGGHVVTIDAACGATKVAKAAGGIAVGLGIGTEQVLPVLHRGNAARVTLHLRARPPFAEGEPIPADPLAAMPEHSMWDWTPCSYNAMGVPLYLRMGADFAGMILGGEPGSGKSAAADGILSWIALDPHARLRIADGKGLDSPVWWPIAEAVTTEDPAGLREMVRGLKADMQARREILRDLGEEKVTRALAEAHPREFGLTFLWVDELAEYAEDKEAQRDLLRLTALCRAFGIRVLTATQKPSAKLIDTDLRDNLSAKWAFACGSWTASNMILGDGMKDAGIDAHEIPEDLPGASWLRIERGSPVFARTWWRDRAFYRGIAAEGVKRRREAGTLPGGSDPIGKPDPIRSDPIVADLLEAVGDATRIHADWAADRMAARWPDRYPGMDGRALRDRVPVPSRRQVWVDRSDGSGNRSGWFREDLTGC